MSQNGNEHGFIPFVAMQPGRPKPNTVLHTCIYAQFWETTFHRRPTRTEGTDEVEEGELLKSTIMFLPFFVEKQLPKTNLSETRFGKQTR